MDIDPSNLTDEQRKQLEEKLKNMSPEEIAQLQKQQCIFCQIIQGKVPAKKVYEDDICVAVLDINPAIKGHLLLLPKEHFAIMPQVPEKVIGHLFLVAREFSHSFLKVMGATGSNIWIANGPAAGQKAQHFMIHVIPRKDKDGLLDLPDKVIEKELIEKVKMAVEEKLYAAIGVKKEDVQKTLTEHAEGKEAEDDEKAGEGEEGSAPDDSVVEEKGMGRQQLEEELLKEIGGLSPGGDDGEDDSEEDTDEEDDSETDESGEEDAEDDESGEVEEDDGVGSDDEDDDSDEEKEESPSQAEKEGEKPTKRPSTSPPPLDEVIGGKKESGQEEESGDEDDKEDDGQVKEAEFEEIDDEKTEEEGAEEEKEVEEDTGEEDSEEEHGGDDSERESDDGEDENADDNEPDEKDESRDDKGEADLDDIANLFK